MVVNWKKSLAWQQILLITPVILLVVLVLAYYLSSQSTVLLTQEIKMRSKRSTELAAAQLDGMFNEAERTARMIAEVVNNNVYSDEQLQEFLAGAIKDLRTVRSEVSGGSITFAPNMRHTDNKYCMWYTYFNHDKQYRVVVNGADYNYFDFGWYKDADRVNGSWSEPYFDSGLGNILMTTYSYPILKMVDNQLQFKGFITVDISLEDLKKYLDKLVDSNSYAFLLSNTGRIVVHPNKKLIMDYTVYDIGKGNLLEYKAFWQSLQQGVAGCVEYPYATEAGYGNDDSVMLSYAGIATNKWLVGSVISQGLLFEPLRMLQRYASIMAISAITLTMLLLALLTWRALRPLRQLTPAANKIGSGDFTVELPKLKRRDEVGQLNNAFAVMQNSLQSYIRELEVNTANRNRMESELAIANQIQQSLLPQMCTLARHNSYQLFAALKPAKVVGGDLFDFFMLSEHEICIAVGDVSGKSIPGALFMAITQTLLRGIAASDLTTNEIVDKINANLSRNNDMMMFVTYFLGIINLKTGVMHYTNAGHNPPLLRAADGKVSVLSGIQGPPLAISDIVYGCAEHQFKPGDMLLLYTDGVTEAIDNQENQFSLDNLENIFTNVPNDIEPEALINKIIRAVFHHAGSAEQFDDMTLLAVRYNGNVE